MTQRLQAIQDIHINLDGQPKIVLSGTVFDAPDNFGYSPSNIIKLAEAAGALGPHGKPTAVRNVRTR